MKNPNATLPTLEAEGQAYTSTAEVTSYFVKKSSTKVKAANPEFIEILHADKIDPNFALFLFVRLFTSRPPFLCCADYSSVCSETMKNTRQSLNWVKVSSVDVSV